MAEKNIEAQVLDQAGIGADMPSETKQPVYKMVSEGKVPVSKALGKLWKSRLNQACALRKRQGLLEKWNSALTYYKSDQTSHRNERERGDVAGNTAVRRTNNEVFAETENIVFANTNAIVPLVYAKNPQAEITAVDQDDETLVEYADIVQELINALAVRTAFPGLNLKPLAKRCVVMAQLTNCAVMALDYTFKEESSDQALADLQNLAKELAEAEDVEEILEIEGKIAALEERVAYLHPAGVHLRVVDIRKLYVDQENYPPKWMIEREMISTAYLQAVFMNEKEDSEEYRLIFQPTHVLKVQGSGAEDSELDLYKSEKEYKAYGYQDEESYKCAQRTECAWAWDATTRRLMLFATHDWTWPIWVWEDKLHLDQFFPYYFLQFYTDPEGTESAGEVTYYLDQQDAINEINDAESRARYDLNWKLFFDKNAGVKSDTIEQLLNHRGAKAIGIDVPEGKKIADMIETPTPAILKAPALFDPSRKIAAAQRIIGLPEVLQGAQFKTNTTNDAIETYNNIATNRLDEKIDAVENWLGDIFWGVAQLCMQFMSAEQVSAIIGARRGQKWQQRTSTEIASAFSVAIVGGSTVKPTSQAKKSEAIKVGQVLGQFASAAPAAVLVALKVMQRAFDEVVLEKDDWDLITQQIMQGQQSPEEALREVESQIDALPDQAKRALGEAMARGVPIRQALEQVMQAVQGQGSKASTVNQNTSGEARG